SPTATAPKKPDKSAHFAIRTAGIGCRYEIIVKPAAPVARRMPGHRLRDRAESSNAAAKMGKNVSATKNPLPIRSFSNTGSRAKNIKRETNNNPGRRLNIEACQWQ